MNYLVQNKVLLLPGDRYTNPGDTISDDDLIGVPLTKITEWISEDTLRPDAPSEPKKKQEEVVHGSVWTLDPESLTNKDLEVLNIMVHERDPSIGPFETEEEAIAQLSKDYGSKSDLRS